MATNMNPTKAVAGNMSIQLPIIFPALPHFTLLKLIEAPHPNIAVDLMEPVEIGKPKNVASMSPINEAISVAKAWYFDKVVIPFPIVLMMENPPMQVPKVMNKATGR